MTQLGITAIALILLSLIFEKPPENIFNAELWLSVTYLAVFGTAFGFVVYYWLIKQASAFLTSFTVFISPVFAVLLGWLILNETINKQGIFGVLLVIIGIAVTLFKKKKLHKKKPEIHSY